MLAAAACYVVAESFDFIQGMRSPPVTLIPSPLGLTWPVFLDMTVMVEELLEDLGTVCIILALAKYLQAMVRAALIGPVVIEENALQQDDVTSES